jgi:protein-disulfide isomerase
MASRKEQKEAARARRLAEEQARAAARQRMRRIQMLGGVAVLAVAIVAVAIVISTRGSSSSGSGTGGIPKTTTAQHKIEKQVDTLLADIPQSGTVLGKPTAPVTLTYYGDLECPICMEFTTGANHSNGGFPQLVANDVRSGKVKVVYRSFCTATCNDHSQSLFNLQQVAAYAAGEQDKFWNYAELFYHEQESELSDYVNDKFLTALAHQVTGLDIAKWQRDRGDPGLLSQVQAGQRQGTAAGVQGTPTVIATGPKGTEPVAAPTGVPSYSNLQQAIKAVT